jgi:hypothetical protein
MLKYVMVMHIVRKTHGYPWICGYPVDLNLERHLCPWILSWAGHSGADEFEHGSSFGISIQTRSIGIINNHQLLLNLFIHI